MKHKKLEFFEDTFKVGRRTFEICIEFENGYPAEISVCGLDVNPYKTTVLQLKGRNCLRERYFIIGIVFHFISVFFPSRNLVITMWAASKVTSNNLQIAKKETKEILKDVRSQILLLVEDINKKLNKKDSK